jgi:aspartokinase/homoserine dehydrogenase 1
MSVERKYRVMKFGGTSLGTPASVAQVVGLVRRERERGPLALVVSAMGPTTSELHRAGTRAAEGARDEALALVAAAGDRVRANLSGAARELGVRVDVPPAVDALLAELREIMGGLFAVRELSPQVRDRVLSFGERLSAVALAQLLQAAGVPAEAVDARAWTVTDDVFGAARPVWSETEARLRALAPAWDGRVPVHTGFIGSTVDGRTTTLGRNGSDYTATLLARGLGAEEVVIWTDVSGVMTADPDLVAEAYPVPHLSYNEALELASVGLGILHPRTMVPLVESGVPLRVRSTVRPDAPGTLVDAAGSADEEKPACVTSLEKMALLDLRGSQLRDGGALSARALSVLGREGIAVWLEAQAAKGSGVALLVEGKDAARAERALREELRRELEDGHLAELRVRAPVTLVTLVAEAMGRTPNVAGRFFGALGALGVNVLASAQGASARAISSVIGAEDTAVAVRSVHAAFNLAAEQVSLLVLGKGTVGGHLLAQIAEQRGRLAAEHDVDLRVVGVVDSKHALWEPAGVDLRSWREQLAAAPPNGDLLSTLDRLRGLPVPVLVDCTAEPGMERVYEEAFRRGIHVVSANKKPLTTDAADAARTHAAARKAHRAWRYETTVGASLPVIETLKNLVRTGDRVELIEGSLSGTLGYLANALTDGTPLGAAVRKAKELGYTEPHPGDDLSGVDAGRKALILARELGLAMSLEQVEIEPFVPAELLEERDLDRFFTGLDRFDAKMAARVDGLRKEGRVLRYLARIVPRGEGGAPRVTVGPVGVPAAHPATRLRGSEAFVAFTTERYAEYPLVVQGAGAGGAVTAAGVLADVLALSQSLRGR